MLATAAKQELAVNEPFYLGLDQSLSNTGYAIYLPETQKTYYGVIKTKQRQSLVERLLSIEEQVAVFCQCRPQGVYLEKVFVQKATAHAANALVRVDAILQRLFFVNRLEYCYVDAHPQHQQSWRRVLGFQAKTEPQERYCISNSHAADAVAILYGGLILQKGLNLETLEHLPRYPTIISHGRIYLL